MQQNETVEVLNDLIQINNDRIEGYEKAMNDAEPIDADLKAIFFKMANESKDYVRELNEAVIGMGGVPTQTTTVSGKVYRAWMDVKAAFTTEDRTNLLELCEFGEDAAQKAYDAALASDAPMSVDVRQLITSQQQSLRTSHDIVKRYRDMHKAIL